MNVIQYHIINATASPNNKIINLVSDRVTTFLPNVKSIELEREMVQVPIANITWFDSDAENDLTLYMINGDIIRLMVDDKAVVQAAITFIAENLGGSN